MELQGCTRKWLKEISQTRNNFFKLLKNLKISLINLENFSPACNVTYVKTNACANCGGRQTPGIKDWASCILEPVAVFLRMLKFDFYNGNKTRYH